MEEKIKPINNLHRAIKNHVFGKEKEFFIATQIGFEQACFNEFTNFFEDAKILEGGIEFKGKFTDCYFLNLHSRIASKILMRIDKFKASNFNSLEKKISKINWEVLINKYSDILINITSKKSRLYHKDAIEESIKKLQNKVL